jgi:hypothetical protein
MVNEYHQVLLEIFVKKAIKERVYACRNHSNQVANYKYQIMVAAHQHLMIPVKDDIEDIQRQPACSKGHHDGNQHGVDPLVLTELALLLLLSVYLPVSLAEADDNLQITDEDEAQRYKVLENKQGGGEEELVRFGGPVLDTGHPVGVDISGEGKVLKGFIGEVIGQKQGNRQQKGNEPNECDAPVGMKYPWFPATGIHNKLIPFNSN